MSTEAQIKNGDVVRLKSGKIAMTIGGISGKVCLCFYEDTSGVIQSIRIDIAALVPYEKKGMTFN